MHSVNMDIIMWMWNVVYLFDCLQRCVIWIGFSVAGHITYGIPEHKGFYLTNTGKLQNALTFPCTDCVDWSRPSLRWGISICIIISLTTVKKTFVFVSTGSFWGPISEGSPRSRGLFHTSSASWQGDKSVDLSKFWKWKLLRGRQFIRRGGHAAGQSKGAGWYIQASNSANGFWEVVHFSLFYLIVSLMAGFSVESCQWWAEETYPRAPDETKEERQVEKRKKIQRKGYCATKAQILEIQICCRKNGQQQELYFVSEPRLIFEHDCILYLILYR